MPKRSAKMKWEDAVDHNHRGEGLMLSPSTVAEGLGVTQQTVCRMLRDRELKGVRVGRVWRVSRDWLMNFMGLE